MLICRDANYEKNHQYYFVNAITNFTLLKNLISREPELKKKMNVYIYYWNSINITASLEIKKNNLKCFLALGRNWANTQMPLEIKSRQKGKYSLVVQKGTDVHMFGNLHRSSFSKAQQQEPPADTAGDTQEDGYILYLPAGPCKNQSPLHPPLNATSSLFSLMIFFFFFKWFI